MRSFVKILFVTAAVVLLCSCGRNASSLWQKQYDLGVRYLNEGRYSEAIIAFTNAISIDDRRALAYEGRGDAWFRMAEKNGSNRNADSSALFASARLDYETTLQLDEVSVSAFEKLASVLELQGETQEAIRTLEQGVELTNNANLAGILADLRSRARSASESGEEPEGTTSGTGEEPEARTETTSETGEETGSETGSEAELEAIDGADTSRAVAASARIFYNPDVYGERWNALIARYQNEDDRTRCSINTYGIRFSSPVSVEINGESVEIQEAECVNLQSVFNADQLYDYNSRRRGDALNTETVVTGIFTYADEAGEISGPVDNESDGYAYYHYNPNGAYVFKILGSDLAGRREA